MTRVAGMICVGLMVAAPALAASPLSTPLLAEATVAPAATDPESAPAQVASVPPGGYTAAPVPDADQAAPPVEAPKPGEAQWAPNLFTGQSTYRGEGFVPGSSVQASQQRNRAPAPGVSLNVPLE
jgi:hypothetical protein